MRVLYSLLLVIARPLVHLRLRWRARKAPGYAERIGERFGQVPDTIPIGALWVHTVSAGETIAATPLIRQLASALAEQNIPVLVTTMTPTGSAEVTRLFGDTVAHCYAPYDFADGVTRFLDAVQPRALVLMETEIWPNMIRLTAQRNVPVALVNARLSERSAKGYARVQTLMSPVLRSFAWIACQYPADAQRFCDIGATPAQVEVVGTVKFDVAQTQVSAEQQEQLAMVTTRAALAGRPVWIAGSTHTGEDAILLSAHKALRAKVPNACLLLVPRHPERFAEVVALASAEFSTAQFSHYLAVAAAPAEFSGTAVANPPAVLVVDVMGLLGALYPLAQVAFVGGSLGDLGGHNPIEAAVARLPVLMGAGRYNFADVCDAFVAADCLHLVTDANDIAAQVHTLLTDEKLRAAQGARAAAVVAAHAGTTQRLLQRLLQLSAARID